MTESGRIRFDGNVLYQHADDYCKKELRLAREWVEYLRVAASYAPVDYVPRIRRLMNDADRLRSYFSKMSDALIESGQLVDAASRAVLERLEDADDKVKTLLK